MKLYNKVDFAHLVVFPIWYVWEIETTSQCSAAWHDREWGKL